MLGSQGGQDYKYKETLYPAHGLRLTSNGNYQDTQDIFFSFLTYFIYFK